MGAVSVILTYPSAGTATPLPEKDVKTCFFDVPTAEVDPVDSTVAVVVPAEFVMTIDTVSEPLLDASAQRSNPQGPAGIVVADEKWLDQSMSELPLVIA